MSDEEIFKAPDADIIPPAPKRDFKTYELTPSLPDPHSKAPFPNRPQTNSKKPNVAETGIVEITAPAVGIFSPMIYRSTTPSFDRYFNALIGCLH